MINKVGKLLCLLKFHSWGWYENPYGNSVVYRCRICGKLFYDVE